MYEILKSKLEGFNENPIKFTEGLLRTPSESLNEKKISELIYNQMQKLGYDRVFRDKIGNVIGMVMGRDSGPNVLLNSHMDTISYNSEENGSDDIYQGHRENGFIMGPGASDCKGGISAQIFAGALLKNSLLPLKGNLIVALTVAEENGRSVGLRALLHETLPGLELQKPDYAILGEPTDLGIYYGHDGWFTSNLNFRGLSPFVVNDAVRFVEEELKILFPNKGNGNNCQILSCLPPIFGINGDECDARIQVDRRIPEMTSATYLKEEFQGILSQIKKYFRGTVNIDVEIPHNEEQVFTGEKFVVPQITSAWSMDPFNPIMLRAKQALSDAGCEIRASKWQLKKMGMGTGGGTLVNEFHIPTIGYGPGDESVAHNPCEVLEVKKLYKAIYGTASIVQSLIGFPVAGWTSDEI